jgi:phage gpG-like protein
VSGVSLAGAARLIARFEEAGARLGTGLGTAGARIGARLAGRVADKLGGAVLHRRSGRLAAAQETTVTISASALAVAVGFDPRAVPYGAIQEYGGTTRAHLIAAKAARALRFSLAGELAFAKSVHHPGSRIPARSFLRSSLAEEADAARADANDAAMEAFQS